MNKYDYEPLSEKIWRLGWDVITMTIIFLASFVIIYLT
jgi:hypothetical protein